MCASDDLGWKGIAQRTYRYVGQDVEIPPMDTFMIVQYQHGETPMDRQVDGRWTRTRCRPGDFSLLSRSAEFALELDGRDRSLAPLSVRLVDGPRRE